MDRQQFLEPEARVKYHGRFSCTSAVLEPGVRIMYELEMQLFEARSKRYVLE